MIYFEHRNCLLSTLSSALTYKSDFNKETHPLKYNVGRHE